MRRDPEGTAEVGGGPPQAQECLESGVVTNSKRNSTFREGKPMKKAGHARNIQRLQPGGQKFKQLRLAVDALRTNFPTILLVDCVILHNGHVRFASRP